MTSAVLLVGHGSVTSLEQLPEFLTSIRHGRPPPPELVAEVRRRYEAIGGRSPLTAITQRVAEQLQARLGRPVRAAARHGEPKLREVIEQLRRDGARELWVVPLAQHSAPIYGDAVRALASDLPVRCAANWGQRTDLLALFAERVRAAVDAVGGRRVRVLLSAHSLPQAVIDAGDPYEREVRAAAQTVSTLANVQDARIVFQSQGMSTVGGRPMVWLGPDLRAALEEAAHDGVEHVVVAPIGFLADHVEILYDLDIEAAGWARELSLGISRSRSLNDDPRFVQVLERIAGELS